MKRLNTLLGYFLAGQLYLAAAWFYDTPLLPSMRLGGAMLVHFASVAAFCLGYWTRSLADRPAAVSGSPRQCAVSPAFFPAAYVALLFGLAVTVAQVSRFSSPAAYLDRLVFGAFDVTIREAYLTPSESGGLSGVLKMFGFAPLGVYLLSLSLLSFAEPAAPARGALRRLNLAALAATAAKVLFTLDRLTIMALAVSNFFVLAARGRLSRPRNLLLLGAFAWFGVFVTTRRIGAVSAADMLFFYPRFGLVNLQMVLNTIRGHSYGFATVFSPALFVLEFFRIPAPLPPMRFDWVWNPAHYLASYVFQDFGAFFFVFFFLLGGFLRTIDREAMQRRRLPYLAVYFPALYCVVTFIAVPAFRGVDFWISVLVPLLLASLFVRETGTGAHLPR